MLPDRLKIRHKFGRVVFNENIFLNKNRNKFIKYGPVTIPQSKYLVNKTKIERIIASKSWCVFFGHPVYRRHVKPPPPHQENETSLSSHF